MQKQPAGGAWRPDGEREAAGNPAAFRLWLAACHGLDLPEPGGLARWAAGQPEAFGAALCAFAGIAPGLGLAAALARAPGRLLRCGPAGCHPLAPSGLAADAPPGALAALLADHLLALDLRPDDVLLWPGPPGDPWPLGALFAGATLLLCDTPPPDPAGAAAAHGARLLRRPG